MKEIWKDIDGTSGRYQISNLGNVRAFTRFRNGELLKPARYSNGYLFIHFAKDTDKKGERHSYLIHRLVAQAFLPNPDGLPQVNHKDEDKTQALEYFTNHDWQGDYSWHQTETEEFINKCIEYLSDDPPTEKGGDDNEL